MDTRLSEDQRAIQDLAQRFTADEITPHAAEWDANHTFPRETIRKAADLGFGAIYIDEASGGIGLGRLEAALIVEAMAYGCPSTAAFISIHNMASWMIACLRRDTVKREIPAGAHHHGVHGQLLPDRTGGRLRRCVIEDAGNP